MASSFAPSPDPALRIRRAKICYLCGLRGADSTEHVLSRCLYPDPKKLPCDVLTLPAHRTCNQSTAKDEEAFRDLISPSLALGNAGHALWNQTWRGLHRPQAARYKTAYYRGIVTRTEIDDRGKRVIVHFASLAPDRVHRVLKKIVSGLFTAMTGELMSHSQLIWEFDGFRSEGEPTIRLPQSTRLHEVLSIRWGRAFDEPMATLWELGFYDTQFVWVSTTPTVRQEQDNAVGGSL